MTHSISLTAVGDVAPLWPIVDAAARTDAWLPLQQADLSMANLELPLTTRTAGGIKAFNLRADPKVAESLRACGIDLVSVANNHAVDYGPDGLLDTVRACRDAGIATVGGGADLTEAFTPVLLDVNGVAVAVLGLASTLPPGFAAGPGRPGVAPVHVQARFFVDAITLAEQPGAVPWVETRVEEADLAGAATEVARARELADLVIVQIHWGVPHGWTGAFQGPLAEYQRPLGHALIDAGADLVLGHHPHMVHGVERHGRGLIVYSLSHFLFHALGEQAQLVPANSYPHYDMSSVSVGPARDTVLFTAEADADGLTRARFIAARLDTAGEPILLAGADAEPVLLHLADASAVLGTKVTLSDEFAEIEFSPRRSVCG